MIITLTPYMVLLLFATRFADYAGASESLSYSYKAHNRFAKETVLIVSDVDVNMFPAMRSIPSGTTDMKLRSCIFNRQNMRQSQIATNQESLPSHFVICRNLWSRQWRHKLSPITLLTGIWKVEFWPIFVFTICIVYNSPNMRCQNELRECI